MSDKKIDERYEILRKHDIQHIRWRGQRSNVLDAMSEYAKIEATAYGHYIVGCIAEDIMPCDYDTYIKLLDEKK